MEPLRHDAIRCLHCRNLREHVALPVRLAARARLQLLGALPHRGSLLFRESISGLLRVLLYNFPLSRREHLLKAIPLDTLTGLSVMHNY